MSVIKDKVRRVKDIAKSVFHSFPSFNLIPASFSHSKYEWFSSPPFRAVRWIKSHELVTSGIRVHSRHAEAYPEVTGYLVPTLLRYGERELAMRLVRWLLCIQRADGSYASHDGKPYVFDTGQVLRGLLAAAEFVPEALKSAERAADYLCGQMLDNGREGFGSRYSGEIPESVHLYVLSPLIEAGEILARSSYREAARHCLDYYCRQPEALQIGTLTHFLGYELEALIDLECIDRAIPVLETLRDLQLEDGALRAKKGAAWICSPGLAQLAICWYKVGMWEPADKALSWLEAHQQPSGGFLGSNGKGASYFPKSELPWAGKFYLDAHCLRVLSFIERNVHIFPAQIPVEEGRAQAILDVVSPKDRVIEIGCGKGRFLKLVREVFPDTQCTGVDISPAMLAEVPAEIQCLEGSLESVPCPDDSFDVVFSVEAIEHSPNPEAAVAEMIRVARPGGWVLVIDKQQSHWGRKVCPPWERWPDVIALKKLLCKGCDNVSAEQIAYDKSPASDGLMVAWRGQKRCRLLGHEWNEVLISDSSQEALINRVRGNHVSSWGQVILLATSPGEKILEVGCGTGEITLQLARAGRKVTGLDFNRDTLEFIQGCADKLGISIETVECDATQELPFSDDEFDCTWSSGLLEHFKTEERRAMIKEQARISRQKVIAMVPNAACVAYRAGKAFKEQQGTWRYGLEIPILSLRDDFKAAGLKYASEYSVGAKQALSFLSVDDPLRKSLSKWMASMSDKDLQNCNQGYLLVTIGAKS